VKNVIRYLNATKHEGIYYWRNEPLPDLPAKPIPALKTDDNYNEMDIAERQEMDGSVLCAAVDADHVGDVSHRKSVTGIVIKLAGGAVLYKTSYQHVQSHYPNGQPKPSANRYNQYLSR